MARPVTTLVIFFVALNAFSGVLMGAGIDSMLGLDAQVGGDEEVNEATQQDDVPTGTGTGSTLFGMYNVLGGFLRSIYSVLFPGLAMLTRAGVPPELTYDLLGNLFTTMILINIASFMRGWDL